MLCLVAWRWDAIEFVIGRGCGLLKFNWPAREGTLHFISEVDVLKHLSRSHWQWKASSCFNSKITSHLVLTMVKMLWCWSFDGVQFDEAGRQRRLVAGICD